ncbi:MAG: type II secretion system F family protein [Caulobacterales bacterium]|jgi:type II secretory pathway component PulF
MIGRYGVRFQNADGVIATADIRADSAAAAARQIAATGGFVLSAAPAATQRQRVDQATATRIAREVSLMLAAGMTLTDALAALARHGAHAKTRALATGLLCDVRAGQSLAGAFAARPDVFPAPFAEIAEAGETSGQLAQALADLAEHREQWAALTNSVRAALVYPAILMVVALMAVGMIFTVVVPRIRQVFTDAQIPPPPAAAFVFAAADIANWAAPVLLALLVLAAIATPIALGRAGARAALDKACLTAPVVRGAFQTLTTARYCRVLALLLRAGVGPALALKLAGQALPNGYARMRLTAVFQDVRRGGEIAAGLEGAGVLAPLAAQMLRVGEASGDLGPSSGRLAALYETRFKRGAEAAMRLAEPILVLVCGVVVGGVVIAMALALSSLNTVNF